MKKLFFMMALVFFFVQRPFRRNGSDGTPASVWDA